MAKQDPSARRLGTMNKRSADPSAKRLGKPPAKKRERTVTSWEDVKHQTKAGVKKVLKKTGAERVLKAGKGVLNVKLPGDRGPGDEPALRKWYSEGLRKDAERKKRVAAAKSPMARIVRGPRRTEGSRYSR